jgi:uncharacterized membrane protein (UPF0136 family)
MNGYSTIQIAAAAVTALYGLVSIVGGILGYVRVGSTISLIAGGAAGLVLLICAGGVFKFPVWSLAASIVVALVLAGRFTSSLMKHSNDLSEVLRTVAIIMVTGGVLVIIVAGLALAAHSRS